MYRLPPQWQYLAAGKKHISPLQTFDSLSDAQKKIILYILIDAIGENFNIQALQAAFPITKVQPVPSW